MDKAPDDTHLDQWSRILLGEIPPGFLLEVVFRLFVIYLILMISMRLLGKRMASQLSRNDMAAMVSLAAAIGVPIISPDRGLLPAVIIAAVVVWISRTIAVKSSRNQKIESLTQGSIDVLIKDSVLEMRKMTTTRISRERIMAELRSHGIKHLGEVKRLYLEANGSFSLLRFKDPQPGLPVIPDVDPEFLHQLPATGALVCHTCGTKKDSGLSNDRCPNCHSHFWVDSVED
jgi:uncharacterized membrane protein YcaP (DUF421 family)